MRAGLTLILGLAAAPAGAAQLSVPDAIDAARAAQVVFVGEVHDNRAHHEAQVEFARALAPRALVFEMIRPEDAPNVADLRDDLFQNACRRRGHIHRRLVGFKTDQRFVELDRVALFFQPLADIGFRNGLARRRHRHFDFLAAG